MKTRYTRTVRAIIVAALALAVAAGASGCSLLESEPERQTFADYGGFFHIDVPAEWSGNVQPGLLVVTAATEIPEEVATLDTFWLLAYSSDEASETPPAEELTMLIDLRAEAREWQSYEMGEIEDTTIGNRDALVVDIVGVDVNGIEFKSRVYFVRSGGREAIINAIAPADEFDEYAEELDIIMTEEWYWQVPASSAAETTTPSE